MSAETRRDFDLSKLAPYTTLAEPMLRFNASKAEALDPHPLRGLVEHGPYTATSFPAMVPAVRVAVVGPGAGRDARRDLLTSLRASHQPTDRRDYVPTYPGFESLFGVEFRAAGPTAHVTWPDHLGELAGETPRDKVRSAIALAIAHLSAVRDQFDVAVVHFPDSWEPGLRSLDFDAHDELKAAGALAGIPTQVVNDSTFAFRYKASRSWRLAIALYVKAGGIPWKLDAGDSTAADTAYIGLAYAFRGDQREARFVTCCSQVFDADGGGMQFVAYDARDPVDDIDAARRNPYLSRDDMRAVLARSLSLYQRRNGGRLPRRVVVHKTTPFRDDEILGAGDALEAIPEMDCLEITADVAWRGVWRRAGQRGRSEPDRYPVLRGTLLQLSGTSALLWAAGNAPAASASGNFYQGGKSIPSPLLLTRHAGRGTFEIPAAEALGLTKMDWNNDALYDPQPVTIQYSKRLARTIANVPTLPRETYPYRLFM